MLAKRGSAAALLSAMAFFCNCIAGYRNKPRSVVA